ncbi:MAG: phosphatase PAP2 family protein [Actinomycetota bacterium]
MTNFPDGHLRGAKGLLLAAGLPTAALAGWALGGIASHAGLAQELDLPLAQTLATHSASWMTRLMRMVTVLGGWPVAAVAATAVGIAWFALRKNFEGPVLLGVSLSGATVLEVVIKTAVGRPRPPVAHLIGARGWSFPSGHALRATVLFGVFAVLAGRLWPGWRARVRLWAVAALLVLLVGASRMILGVHYLTDVLGGIALGAAWLAITTTAFPPRAPRA